MRGESLIKAAAEPKRTIPPKPKTFYKVTIEDTVYHTAAYTEEAALSNACFRYAEENDENVGRVSWQVKNDKLYSNVEGV